MKWAPSCAKVSPEGVEFGMTDGTVTRACFISQQEINKWTFHIGAIDQDIAFRLFCEHAPEIYAAAARRLEASPSAARTVITAKDRLKLSARRARVVLASKLLWP